jgi:small conductance mechanosensitive channel
VALAALAISVGLALVVAQVLLTVMRRALIGPSGGTPPAHAGALRALIRLMALVVAVILTVVFVPPVLEMFGEPLTSGLRLKTLQDWFFNSGLRVLIVLTLAYLLLEATGVVVSRMEKSLGTARTAPAPEEAKRARTLADLVGNVFRALVIAIAVIAVLGDLGVNIQPILTSAGILGLAVGFGAQTLVKDVISGFFLILENQVSVGDVAEINGTGGLIEAITLRTLVLRDARGARFVFPNGSITTLANLTKDYAYAVLDILVHHRHDSDQVVKVIEDTGKTLEADPAFQPLILAPLEVNGIENITDSGMTIRVRMRTVPQRQWDVARELRRRIKMAFDQNDIEIPFVTLVKK